MPGVMTGTQLVEAVRGDDPLIPIVLMSAFADVAPREWQSRLDVGLLVKPFGLQELYAALALRMDEV